MARQAAFDKVLKRLSSLRRPLSALYVDESATAKSFWADVVNDGCPGTLDPRNFVVQTKL